MEKNIETPKKKPFYKKWWVWVLAVFILFIIIGESGTPTPQDENIQQHQLLDYKIVEQEDTSYLGCKRVGLRVVVSDESIEDDVNFTLDKIINDYKSEWDDITVWAYKNSEESQVGLIGFTKGMKEYSTCN